MRKRNLCQNSYLLKVEKYNTCKSIFHVYDVNHRFYVCDCCRYITLLENLGIDINTRWNKSNFSKFVLFGPEPSLVRYNQRVGKVRKFKKIT